MIILPVLLDHCRAASRGVCAVAARGVRSTPVVCLNRLLLEPEELLALRRHGFDLVTLGPRTLRTDVALVGLVALVQDWLDS